MEEDLDRCLVPYERPKSPLWTFSDVLDHLFSSPVSLSDQDRSPLWTFSIGNCSTSSLDDDNHAGNATSTLSGNSESILHNSQLESYQNGTMSSLVPGFVPMEYSAGSFVERMKMALRHLKEMTDQHVLAQFWVPIKIGDRYVLTTSGQPFVLDPNSGGLHQYRMASIMYGFSLDKGSDEGLDIIGCVFKQKQPEWTPNVQFYSSKEYSRLNHALQYNVRGTLALPVFEPSGKSCVGVLELIMTSQKINFSPEIDKIRKALEAVDLRSSNIFDHPRRSKIRYEDRRDDLADILEILTLLAETYNLPLVQTWIPYMDHNVLAYGCGNMEKSCNIFDGSCMGKVIMSTADVAFYVKDAHMWGFREACGEHHLLEGQGIVGRALASQTKCFFCHDITILSKLEYPLVHYARLFGLKSSIAICLQSTCTVNNMYILEIFLPPRKENSEDLHTLLTSMTETMKQHCHRYEAFSGEEITKKLSVEVIMSSVNDEPDHYNMSQATRSLHRRESFNSEGETQLLDSQNQEFIIKDGTVREDSSMDAEQGDTAVTCIDKTLLGQTTAEGTNGVNEILLSFEVLKQNFHRNLNDASEHLGISRSTLKRACRKQGISRWPSKKAKHCPSNIKSSNMFGQNGERRISESNSIDITRCNAPHDQAAATIDHTVHHETTFQDEGSLTIKAKLYRNDNGATTTIKFQLPFSSTLDDLRAKVGQRLRLKDDTFDIEYLDNDGDWVLIYCEEDLQQYVIDLARSSKNNTVQMLVKLQKAD